MKLRAVRQHNLAQKLLKKGDLSGAEQKYRNAIEADATWAIPWFNLGLLYKRQQRWSDSLLCNQQATYLDPQDQAGWWNLGIAATALSNWAEARRAWTGFGAKIPEGEGPLTMELGPTPIRVNPQTKPEIVWCTRIDPARAIIRNVPLPASEHCYGDLLLHDGEPKGFRMVQDKEVPVFDELAVLTPSDYTTYEIVVETTLAADRKALVELAESGHLAIEDWSTIRMLCKACSEGRPHAAHEVQPPETSDLVRYGVAARDEIELYTVLNAWQAERPACQVLEFTCVLKRLA